MNTPYRILPEAPPAIVPGAILARLVDGIGFRYHWATEGLDDADLPYKPAPDCRSLGELLEHIMGLLGWVAGAAGAAGKSEGAKPATVADLRSATLHLARALREKFIQMTDEELRACTIRLSSGDAFPFWNFLNGPLADILTHVGQVLSWRRMLGKPGPKANVFRGLPPNPA
jgi:hypothetical protein